MTSFARIGLLLGCCTLALLALAPFAAAEIRSEDIQESLEAVRAVEREGQGHAAAAKAWKKLAAAEVEQLPAVLAGIDGANPLAANWVRAAVDSIAERAVQRGQSLPCADLEQFVLDTDHAPKGRRLAYEWLCKGDATAVERLVPGFLHDPGTEFRRDAVARLLGIVKGATDRKDQATARKTLHEALTGARDLDQVKDIAKQLGDLGEKVDLQAHYGFLTSWKLIGPFDNAGEKGFNIINPPETAVELAAQYAGKQGADVAWIDHVTADDFGMVDLNKALGKAMGATAYAFAEFQSDKEQTVDFRLGCICACKLWVNGELVDQREVYHSGTSLDQYVSQARLKPGKNSVLLKVLQNEQTESWAQDWSFQLRVCDATGTAILSTAK